MNKIFSFEKIEYYRILTIFGIKLKFFSKRKVERLKKDKERFWQLLNIIVKPEKLPKATGALREEQLFCFGLLKDIKTICEENNLKYWLDFGTLLGAVRHKGFIPWDSDADLSVSRKDFYRLYDLLQEKYSNSSEVVVRSIGNKNHFQLRLYSKKDLVYGVDIFPIDEYYLPYEKIVSIEDANNKILKAHKKLNRSCALNKEYILNPTKNRTLIDNITKEIILEYNDVICRNPAQFYGINYKFVDPKNLIIPYERIFPLSQIEFEGELFTCPRDVDLYLQNYYGKNYMKYPTRFKPEEDKIDEYIEGII